MISALCWAPRSGVASVPKYFEPSEEQIQQWKKDAEEAGVADAAEANIDQVFGDQDDGSDSGSDMETGGGGAKKASKKSAKQKAKEVASLMKDEKVQQDKDSDEEDDDNRPSDLSRYNLDTYDDEPEMDLGDSLLQAGGLMAFESNAQDPYMEGDDAEEEEDEEDIVIRASDAIVLTTKFEDEVPCLEVNVFDQQKQVLYLHHDVMLPSFPLCVTWMDCVGTNRQNGNFAAVGTMQPAIEIWDMDVMDAMEPVLVLGGEDIEQTEIKRVELKKKLKEKKKKGKKAKINKEDVMVYKKDSHTDAVLGLSWNSLHRNLLASGSADNLVKVWDVTTASAVANLTHHTSKVQVVDWQKTSGAIGEGTSLLTGSFDRSVCVIDMRTNALTHKYMLSSDVECCQWDPHNSFGYIVSNEGGEISYVDIRKQKNPVFTLSAHSKSVTGLSINPNIPNCVATASMDKSLKVWDIQGGAPRIVCEKEAQIGKVFCCSWAIELPFVVAAGGSQGRLCVWDTAENRGMREVFGPRLPGVDLREYESAADGAALAVEKMCLDGHDDDDEDEGKAKKGSKGAKGGKKGGKGGKK